uniref:PHD-type domain-containing protein n=1 Tax=Meloidogyne incognita TaxID=6306 RepID=A0A914LV05_MELIC
MFPASNIEAIHSINEKLDDKNDADNTEINGIQNRVNHNGTNSSKNKRHKAQFHHKQRKNSTRQIFPQKLQEHLTLMQKVNERYGCMRKEKGELKEAKLDTSAKRYQRAIHPASYQRMMQRVMDSHKLRLLQPEPPANLLHGNMLCALCFQHCGTNQRPLGELFGPYFVSISAECHPPERIMPRTLLPQSKQNNEERSTRSPSSIDVWIHGECALWTPDLFLIGGRFPNLQNNIFRYWKQKCAVCGDMYWCDNSFGWGVKTNIQA